MKLADIIKNTRNVVGALFVGSRIVLPNISYALEPPATIKYDEQRNVIEKIYDYDGDKKPDSIIKYENDEQGKIVKEFHDSNADGKTDLIVTHEYNKQGNIIKTINDSNMDGKPDVIIINKYDPKTGLKTSKIVKLIYENKELILEEYNYNTD